jgi:predicted DNA-binding transcriptional regulator
MHPNYAVPIAYICTAISKMINRPKVIGQSMSSKGLKTHLKTLMAMVSKTFRLPSTGTQILETLINCRRALSVKELVQHVRRSERSVRGALDQLVGKGVLIRKVSLTGRKRLAYLYSLGPMDRVIKVLRSEILDQLETLERLEGTLHNVGGAIQRSGQ